LTSLTGGFRSVINKKLTLHPCLKLNAGNIPVMQKRKFTVWLPVILSLSMIIGMFLGYRMRDSIPGKSFFHRERSGALQEVMQLIDDYYVDSVTMRSLSDSAIQSMLAKLDPHTVYIPAEELQQVNDELMGGFFGIGVEFNIFDDTVHVINVLKDGPGFKAGLKSGDKIIKAGDSTLAGRGLNADQVRSVLRGKKGSIVVAAVLRGKKMINIEISRGMIPLSSVDAAYMVDSTVGYIRLNKFSQLTYKEFMESLDMLKAKGMKKLIFDLRDNGGGVLDEAVEIVDEFLDGDKLITYTEGRQTKRKDYRCRRLGQFEQGELVVLINEGTASASEIISGALQDWDRATIIGRRSFGKGLVQEQFELSDGSALRLTVARYYTPLGRSIQRPYSNGEQAYYDEVMDRFHGGEYLHADSVKLDSSQQFKSRKGKILFGGGGINPDIFVGGDTGRVGAYASKVILKGTVSNFGYRYLLAYPSIETKYEDPGAFSRNFQLDNDAWNLFYSMAGKDSIPGKPSGAEELQYLSGSLKRSIARQLWRNEGFYRMVNTDDKLMFKAMQVLKD
jgi:carboxyl-terminal processing protease